MTKRRSRKGEMSRRTGESTRRKMGRMTMRRMGGMTMRMSQMSRRRREVR
jgi:hypothetical protein